jgi:hypothetical protein
MSKAVINDVIQITHLIKIINKKSDIKNQLEKLNEIIKILKAITQCFKVKRG